MWSGSAMGPDFQYPAIGEMAMPETPEKTHESPGDPEALQAERARAEQAEKRLREVEAALQSAQQSHESAVQELQDRLATGNALAEQAAAERDRVKVAHAKQVPSELLEFLQGSSAEELEASADKLMAHIAAPKVPVPDPLQGASGKKPPADPRRELLSQVFKNP